MALTVADAKKIVAKSEEKKLCVAVGQQRRYNLIYDHALGDGPQGPARPAALPPRTVAFGQAGEGGWQDHGRRRQANGENIDWWPDVPKEDARGISPATAAPMNWSAGGSTRNTAAACWPNWAASFSTRRSMLVAAAPNHDPKRPYPLSVAGSASQVLRDAEGDIDDHVHCIFEYAIQGYVDAKEIPPKARKKIALQFDLHLGQRLRHLRRDRARAQRLAGRWRASARGMIYYMEDATRSSAWRRRRTHKGARRAPTLEVPKDGKADEDSEAFGELLLRGADARLRRRIGALGLLLQAAGRRQERR